MKKKSTIPEKIFVGVGMALLMMLAYLAVQIVVVMGAGIVVSVYYGVTQTDVQKVTESIQSRITDPEFLTIVTVIGTLLSVILSVTWYGLVYGKKKTAEEKEFFKKKVCKIPNFVTVAVACISVYFFAVLIVEVMTMLCPAVVEQFEETMNMSFGGNAVLGTIAVVVLAPIGEECLMRGVIRKWLQKYFSVPAVILISAVLFGVFHMNIVQGIYVIPMGILFAYIACRTDSVWLAIFAHFVNNGFSNVLDLIMPEMSDIGMMIVSVVLMVVFGVLAVFLNKTIVTVPTLREQIAEMEAVFQEE